MDTRTHDANKVPPQHAHITGWGADLDHANRPGYPMERQPSRLRGLHWDQPARQPENVEVLVSKDRPGLPPIFGATLPPTGASGLLRRAAFHYTESDLRHWALLLLADRVNVVEGIGHDLLRGKVPNIFAEMGGKAEFRYNRDAAVKKTIAAAAVVGVAALLVARSRSRRRR
jgi:hypothetical protein